MSDTQAGSVLVSLLIEQRQSWQRGERVPAEDFLRQHPALTDDAALDLIGNELLLRQEGGETPQLEEYVQRFPRWEAALRRQFEVERALGLASSAATAVTLGATAPWASPTSAGLTQPIPGYDLLAELGRGGMGVVCRARDHQFRRGLAIKVLALEHGRDADLKRRFLEEAQLMGQLQHPNIPPVHELGELPDGRPYFAMKLIQGKTLAALLKERAGPEQDHPRLLSIFEQICQALAYAHAQGVVHRDLKPANVMIGSFGEVQVMDWGLAKVMKAAASADAPHPISTVRSDAPDAATQVGQALGTPAYMAPEQARGEAAQLDERCDVFGLGAILCEVLTGAPPFTGGGLRAVVELAQLGRVEPAMARLEGAADRELVALAGRCLAPHKHDRPAHAGLVLQAIQAYLAGVQERLRQTELARAQAEVRAAEECKRRRLHLALAAAVLVLLSLAGVGGWLHLEQKTEQERSELLRLQEKALAHEQSRAAALHALGQGQQLQTRALWQQARAAFTQAQQSADAAGDDALLARTSGALKDLAIVEGLDHIRQQKARIVDNRLDYGSAPSAYLAFFGQLGFDFRNDSEASLVERLSASPVHAHLVAALDDWAVSEPDDQLEKRLWRLTARLTAQPWRTGVRTALKDRGTLEAWLARVPPAELTPALLATLGWELLRRGGDGMVVLEPARLRHPGDFWVWFAIGSGQARRPAHARQARDAYAACLALRPESPVVWYNLGILLKEQGELQEARNAFQQSLVLEPASALAHHNLGLVLQELGDRAGALAAYEQAIRFDPTYAPAHNNLGSLYAEQGKKTAAATAYRKAIALDPKYAAPHNNLGNLLRAQGDRKGAAAAFRHALKLAPAFAQAHNGLGLTLADLGDIKGALAAYQLAIKHDPKNAHPRANLGNLLRELGDLKGAAAALREAIRLDPKDAAAHNNLGNALLDDGDLKGATAAFQEAIRLDPKDAFPRNGLGMALQDQGDLKGALAAFEEAIRLDPNYSGAHTNRGNVLWEQGKVDAAIAAYETATKLNPKSAAAHANLAKLRFMQGHYAASTAAYQATFAADPNYGAVPAIDTRLEAVRAALAAAAGQGKDAAKLGAEEKAKLRRQALTWLQSDLAAWTKLHAQDARSARLVMQVLGQWKQGKEFALVREEKQRELLPAAERAEWQRLWRAVDALLAGAAKTPPS